MAGVFMQENQIVVNKNFWGSVDRCGAWDILRDMETRMELTLPDLNGLLREGHIPHEHTSPGIEIPVEWVSKRNDVPFGAIFGMSPDRGPVLVTVRLDSQPYWEFVREQFPSLRKTDCVEYAMSEIDYTKMRMFFGGDW